MLEREIDFVIVIVVLLNLVLYIVEKRLLIWFIKFRNL